MSLTSLCLMIVKPPLGQDKECSIEKGEPHSHVEGKLGGIQPYLRDSAFTDNGATQFS